jgi:hypothetical protein
MTIDAKRRVKKAKMMDDDAVDVRIEGKGDARVFSAADLFGVSNERMAELAERMHVMEKGYESMLDVAEGLDLQNAGEVAAKAFFFGQLVHRNQLSAKTQKTMQKFEQFIRENKDDLPF